MRALALWLVLVGSASADPRTGEVVLERSAPSPSATLYLRTDGPVTPQARDAIAAAAALLANEPGATVAVALEPRDSGSPPLADVLVERSMTARIELLQRLVERNAPRFTQRDAVEYAAGLPPTSLATPPQVRRFTLERYVVSPRGRSLLGRAPGIAVPGKSALVPTVERVTPHDASLGVAGHELVLPWRAPRDACGPLELLGRIERAGRVRISIAPLVDPSATPGVRALARELGKLTPDMQLAVARQACVQPSVTIEQVVAILLAAGVTPMTVGRLDGSAPSASLPPSMGPLLDGDPTTFLDALSLQKPPSLKKRLSTVDRRR